MPLFISPTPAEARPTALEDAPNYAHAPGMEHLLHWSHMPIRVYFVPSETATAERRQQALAGFDEWVRATNGFVSYQVVGSARQAELTVAMDPDATVPGEHGAIGNTSVIFTETQLESAAMELAAGSTTPNQFQGVAAHEFGHALGIDGHSDDTDDLMTPSQLRYYDPYGSPLDAPAHPVTARDLSTLAICYGVRFGTPARSRLVKDADQDFERIEPVDQSR